MSPIWVHRLFGYEGQTDKVFSPYWINNEEYCYVRVKSYFSPINEVPSPLQIIDGFLRGPNATFYIYKVNINQPDERKLIREISEKVNSGMGPLQHNTLDGETFRFRRLDNGNLILLIRGRSEDITYKMNTKGKILMKWIPGFHYDLGSSLDDISPDGKKSLTFHNGINIKDIASSAEVPFSTPGMASWVSKDKLIAYSTVFFEKNGKLRDPTKFRYEIYLIDDNNKSPELVYAEDYLKYSGYKVVPFSLDAALFPDQNLLFLSRIGIFKKQDNNTWQMIGNLKDMDFNFFSPSWSPDGKRLVGVLDDKNLKVIEVKDLLR